MIELLFSLLVGVADLALVKFGGVLVRAMSLGRWKAEKLRSNDYRYKAEAGALSYFDEGTRVVTHTGQLAIALVFWAALGFGLYVTST